MTRRIIINIEDDISDEVAISLVSVVVKEGKISNDGTEYCHLVSFQQGHLVASNLRKSKSQIFYVTKEKQQ